MNLLKHLDKDNLHHAYLIEGNREEILPEILEFFESLKIKTSGNPDFIQISIDNLKIDDAFLLRTMSTDKGFSTSKKIFLISVNSFSLDAQNVLLKMFEEPIENTHFFLIVPDVNALLKTLISRFYLISTRTVLAEGTQGAEKFLAMSLKERIDFIKELLTEEELEDEKGNEVIVLDSARSKALKFLNALEVSLHSRFLKNYAGSSLPGVPDGSHTDQNFLETCLQHFFKVREFLRVPGSSTKTLMESVAIVVPSF